MKISAKMLFILSFGALVMSCSSKPEIIKPPEWAYEKDAIRLRFKGDADLNIFQKKAHSLVVCVYQLRDLNGFNQLKDEKDGLQSLLECNRFDPGVTYARKLILQPGSELSEVMDRTDGARYVGVAAGFYNLQKESSTHFREIPVSEEIIKKTLIRKPAKMDLELNFGPQEIRRTEENKEEKENK